MTNIKQASPMVLSALRALQLDPTTPLHAATDPDHAHHDDDLVRVTTQMADFNLLTLPVLDEHSHILERRVEQRGVQVGYGASRSSSRPAWT